MQVPGALFDESAVQAPGICGRREQGRHAEHPVRAHRSRRQAAPRTAQALSCPRRRHRRGGGARGSRAGGRGLTGRHRGASGKEGCAPAHSWCGHGERRCSHGQRGSGLALRRRRVRVAPCVQLPRRGGGARCECLQNEAWIRSNGIDALKPAQTAVLLCTRRTRDRPGAPVNYVAHEHLIGDTPPEPLKHPLLDEYFSGFDSPSGRFVPTAVLRSRYPLPPGKRDVVRTDAALPEATSDIEDID